MSSTGQVVSSTSRSGSNFQQIFDNALVEYSQTTGIDLSKNRFAAEIARVDSPEDILQLLQERVHLYNLKKFPRKFRNHGNQTLTSTLNPAVRVLHAFSGTLSEATSTVPIPPASVIFAGIDTLLATASGATSSYNDLIDLFENLGNFLKRLEIYTTIPPSLIMTELIVKILVELLSVLALATKKYKEGRLKKLIKKLLREREIEDALQRLDKLTQEEVRVAVAQTLGVVHGLVDDVKRLVGESEASMDSIRQDLERNNMKRIQLRRDVQHWLSPPNPSTNHNTLWNARHQGTAAWLLQNDVFKKWKMTGSMLWIHGNPGSGKSTLLSAIIEDIRGMRAAGLASMAYYYFDFHDVKKQDRYGLLSSLLVQLSAESNAYYEVLSRLYEENAGGTTTPTRDALLGCLKEMLSLPGHASIYIVVDALDECPNFSERPSAREEVLELMEELVRLGLPGLHLCVASRPEIDIRMVIEPLTHLQISLHDEAGQTGDINDYIHAIVHSDRRMRRWNEEDRNLVVEKLSQNADGNFRWVVCQLDTLCYSFPHNIRSVLAALPPSLDETYEKALLGINKEKQEYALRLYQCLVVAIRPLRVEELADILAIQFDEVVSPTFNPAWRPENAEEAVLSACSSLVAIVDEEGHRVVQFSHFSVKEYLTSERLSTAEERLSYYHILPEPAHTILAQASLSVLLQLNDKIDRNTTDHLPLSLYAARHWVDHAQFGDVSSRVQELMERLFDPAMPHFAAWVWIYNIDRDQIEPMSEAHPTQPSAVPLYYASLCGFYGLVEHLLVAHPQHVNTLGGRYGTSLCAALEREHVKVAQLLLQHGAYADTYARYDRHHGRDRTPVHIAAEHGHTEVIQSLINCGADTNVEDWDGRTPLALASRKGSYRAAQLLSERDTYYLDHQDYPGWTPLYEALDNNHVDIVRLLLDRGADASFCGRGFRSPLHLAASRGGLVASQLLVQRGAEVDIPDISGRTPLHFASEHGDPEIVRFLINHGANPDKQKNKQEVPLFLASREGKLEAARVLSEHSADINVQDWHGRTSLYVAAANGHYEIVELLLNKGADLNTPETHLQTPLHPVANQGIFKVAELLLEYGAEVDAQDEIDRTPLHYAAEQGHMELVRLLLEHHADVLALDYLGRTFLDLAWEGGHKEIVDINARYDGGQTALHIAAQNGDTELMSWLIHHKSDPIHPNVEDEDQETPLFPASRNGKLKATQLLLDADAAPNHRDWQEMTPLHGVSENGHDAVAQLLLERNAEVNAKHKNSWTPLHLASRAGWDNVAMVLLDNDAMVNAQNDSNWTPIHMASQEGHLDVVRLLLTNGADANIQNDAGETALHLAVYYAHVDVAQVLLSHGADLPIENNKGETAETMRSKDGKTLSELERDYENRALVGDPELGEISAGEPDEEPRPPAREAEIVTIMSAW